MRIHHPRPDPGRAIIAAVCAVLTVAPAHSTVRPVQCRLAEAMTILPLLFPGGDAGAGGVLNRQPVPLSAGRAVRNPWPPLLAC